MQTLLAIGTESQKDDLVVIPFMKTIEILLASDYLAEPELTKDLLEIQKRKKDLAPQEYKNSQNINVDKAVFVGSTTELVKFLKSNK